MASEEALVSKIARGVLNRPGESDSHEFETLKKLVTKYPFIASSKSFQMEYNHTIRVEFPLFAFATKRVGASWTQHMELLQLFYHAYPEAIQYTTSYGHLPLHAACDNGLDPRIILYFLEQYPQAASVKHCKGGWTPLAYYIMSSHQTLEHVVKAFINAAPTCIEHECTYGRVGTNNIGTTSLPPPLHLAFCKNCSDSVLSLLVPTNPENPSLMLDYDIEHEDLIGVITSARAEMIATRVAPWIRALRLNTKWFTRSGLATFFSKLAAPPTSSLEALEVNITSKVFADVIVRNAFSDLIRQSPNLRDFLVKKPEDDDIGPSNDDTFLSCLACALNGHEKLQTLFLSGLGGSSARLSGIMTSCRDLKSVAVSNMAFTSDGVDSLVQGIHKSSTLDHVCIAFCSMPTGGMDRVLEAMATSATINKLQLAISQAQDLPALSQLTNLGYLSVGMDPMDDKLYDHGPTKSILNLLETSTNLMRLDTRNFALPASGLSEILKRNNTLNTLKIRDYINANDMVQSIVEALCESNATLLEVEVESVGERISDELLQQLQYYTALNRTGRSQIIKAETANVSDLVQILIHLSAVDAQGHDGMKNVTSILRYGILRESPSLWSSHYNNEYQAPLSMETQDETTASMQSVLQGMQGLGLEQGQEESYDEE